eukprot:CAMPEP_0184673932 /NCGR_PEP_ID=MMETSP0308-20130426/86956_1 /TAXON_ID=38269 /ORGANISM="Gloeochaete witrockiana, Strain SAG 46.84" /LENGTH=74 /DNA_ID=CAMNT_0027121477 /DNA_START=476 /DNA_END=697 /DNA_ORIENTATION=-
MTETMICACTCFQACEDLIQQMDYKHVLAPQEACVKGGVANNQPDANSSCSSLSITQWTLLRPEGEVGDPCGWL